MKYVEFRLTMPHVASWNGKWTGEGNYYAKLFKVTNALFEDKYRKHIGNNYRHRWDDGWEANIAVREINTSKEFRELQKKSKGFWGYGWMIDNILLYGDPRKPELEREGEDGK